MSNNPNESDDKYSRVAEDESIVLEESSSDLERRNTIINVVGGGLLATVGVASWQLYSLTVYTPPGFVRVFRRLGSWLPWVRPLLNKAPTPKNGACGDKIPVPAASFCKITKQTWSNATMWHRLAVGPLIHRIGGSKNMVRA